MNEKYDPGLLLEARTNIPGYIIKRLKDGERATPVAIPYKNCVILLEYVRAFKEEYISVLWDNKIVYITNLDLEHHFKILG